MYNKKLFLYFDVTIDSLREFLNVYCLTACFEILFTKVLISFVPRGEDRVIKTEKVC